MKKKKIGLALGSGSALGLAHIGVLKQLEKHNIKPDFITGTSIGAVIGAAYAAGCSSHEIEKKLFSIEWSRMFDFTVPKKGLISGKFIELLLEDLTKNKNFKDLKIPLKIIATDLENSNKIVFEKGKVSAAVRASMSIPGIFTPVEFGETIAVDGGLVEPIPAATLKDMGADIIIAVDVGTSYPTKYARSPKDHSLFLRLEHKFVRSQLLFFKQAVSRAKRFPRFLRRLALRIIDKFIHPEKIVRYIVEGRVPTIARIMDKAISITTNSLIKEQLKQPFIDVIIKPKLYGVDWSDFDRGRYLIKKGSMSASRSIKKIKSLAGLK